MPPYVAHHLIRGDDVKNLLHMINPNHNFYETNDWFRHIVLTYASFAQIFPQRYPTVFVVYYSIALAHHGNSVRRPEHYNDSLARRCEDKVWVEMEMCRGIRYNKLMGWTLDLHFRILVWQGFDISKALIGKVLAVWIPRNRITRNFSYFATSIWLAKSVQSN